MITLYDAQNNTPLGELTDEQLKELVDNLEEEFAGDRDYYINQETVDLLQEAGVSESVLNLLRRAIAAGGEADIRWSQS